MIKEATEKANRLDSKIPIEVIQTLDGLSSPKCWHLINNLAAQAKNYLEIGTYLGGTLRAAMYGNELNVVAMDNFCMKPRLRDHFYGNVKELDFTFYEEDCFAFDLKQIEDKIDLYFYDAEHSYESQYKALAYYYPVLADEFIYICDDWTNKPVKDGTLQAIKDLNLQIVECEIRGDGQSKNKDEWWCGFAAFKLKKC